MPSFEKRLAVTGKKIVDKAMEGVSGPSEYRVPINQETPSWAFLLAKEIGGKVIASGSERMVIDRGNGKVLGIYKYPELENAESLKEKYYVFKILHTIFPESFPRMYAAGESSSLPKKYDFLKPALRKFFPEHFLLFDIKEKISTERPIAKESISPTGSRATTYYREPRMIQPDREGPSLEKHAVDAWRIMHEIGFDLNLDYDNHRNFIDGIYVDSEVYFRREDGKLLSEEDKGRLLDWMEEQKYSEDAISKVSNAFERLIEIDKNKKVIEGEKSNSEEERGNLGYPWEMPGF